MRDRGQLLVDACLWALTGLGLAAIIAWSLSPDPWIPFHFRLFNEGGLYLYVYHGAAYATFTFGLLLSAVWRPGRERGVIPAAWMVIGPTIGFGIALEGIQVFLPRDASAGDAMANAAGVLLAYGVWKLMGGKNPPSGEG